MRGCEGVGYGCYHVIRRPTDQMFRLFNDLVISGKLFIRALNRLVLVFCDWEVAGPSGGGGGGGSCVPIMQ